MGSPASPSLSYPGGIHVPTLTWFHSDERQRIDWETQTQHLRFLIESGLDGIVIAGTNGEAATLSCDEKVSLIHLTRKIAQESGRPNLPITVGCSGGCTSMAIEETEAAASAGADFALVLVPSYFHFAMDSTSITSFFLEVADSSPIPLVVYNFPGVVAGLDVNSEMLDVLGEHRNIVAVKLTCGGIGKVARVAAKFGTAAEKDNMAPFKALAGQSDWLVPALSSGGAGCITGLANLYPKACMEMHKLWLSGDIAGASELQIKFATCEIGFGQGGINGTKWVVAEMRGYPAESAHCRRPYPQYTDEKKKAWILTKMKLCYDVESALSV